MRSLVACAAVVSPKPVPAEVGFSVETASGVEWVGVVSDVVYGNTDCGNGAVEHPVHQSKENSGGSFY